ncbi:LINE-1 retrotransposable element ORF2 protein [Erysiphe neolycopersici]|uniref:LINE-1 retrotransposable element ORF2 protein n=1 Tax=Erysiphe neolycopersici TaxID=212602 RepID=A0A420HCL0_9PEZI|nr:LINE-1 retrotransposable element ORF2 protein [Erysiphe neolycopersici]
MKSLLINIKGGGQFQKMVTIVNLSNTNADIVFMCETHFTPDKLQRYKQNWPNIAWYSNSPYNNQSGIACIVLNTNKTPTSTTRIVDMDNDGRILGIEIRTDGGKLVRILGLYAPNEETQSVEFFKQLNSRGLKGYHIILGDMNKCEAAIDRNPSRLEDLRVVEAFQHAFENNGFRDGWRMSKPEVRAYTYWSDNSICSASRIDRIYVSLKTFRKCANWEIINTPKWSDHSAVSVEYYPHDKIKRGPGIWRMNTTLLKRPDLRNEMVTIIRSGIQEMFLLQQCFSQSTQYENTKLAVEIFTLFDDMMQNVRSCAMRYQINFATSQHKLKLKLERRLAKYDSKERKPRYARRVKLTRWRLKALLEEQSHKQTLFSYAKNVEAGGY